MDSRITESSSYYDGLDNMSVSELLKHINHEDKTVPFAVEKVLPQIEHLIHKVISNFKKGGRLFYIGAGTSGRLGIVDASECPPTYGVEHGMVIGLMAGGDKAIRKAVEFAEDDKQLGWKDLESYGIGNNDTLIGISASGTAPYVLGAMQEARKHGIATGCIVCNPNSPMAASAEFPIEVTVGPEFVTGSTRMKAGTAQKIILNMITTTSMVKLGKVKGNRMVDMQLSNAKLVDRGVRMIMEELGTDRKMAESLLKKHGSVRRAVNEFRNNSHECN